MRCVVTGGTGFLGSRLVERLREEGHQVQAVSRSTGVDVTCKDTLGEPLRDCQALFHLAALVQSRPGPFEEVNVAGVRNVLEAGRAQEVERVVYVSSFTIFGPSGERPHTEQDVPERACFFHGYDRTKYLGYREAESWKSRLAMNIIFPTVVFGPGPLTEGNIMVRLLRRWARLRVAALPGGGSPRWNFVHRDDVVEGLVRVLKAPAGEDYILGGANCSLRELSDSFRKVSGRPIAPLGLPAWLFRAGCHLEDWASRLARFTPLVLPDTAGFFLEDWRFSSRKAESRLSYAARSLEEGLSDTWQWMRQQEMA